LPVDHIQRAMEIDERYTDLGLGLVDTSVVALAEDIRHFAAVRLRDGRAFDLVVRSHRRLSPSSSFLLHQ
jgi:predicted nucleic acid-binding protein